MAVVVGIIVFCVVMFDMYAKPSDENTSMERGTVADVYYSSGIKEVVIEMSDGEQFQLVCPWLPKDLYSEIGYDIDRLDKLLTGQNIKYRKMDKMPWIVEIYINNMVIDNNKMTCEEIITTRMGIVILGFIMLVIPVCIEVGYIKSKYKIYKKAEKKRSRSK